MIAALSAETIYYFRSLGKGGDPNNVTQVVQQPQIIVRAIVNTLIYIWHGATLETVALQRTCNGQTLSQGSRKASTKNLSVSELLKLKGHAGAAVHATSWGHWLRLVLPENDILK